MSKKLKENGLFESSRMMLPEHKEAYIQQQQQLNKRKRPLLDGQHTEYISGMIAESMLSQRDITIVLFGELGETKVTGKVVTIHQQKGEVKVVTDSGLEWIKFENIVSAAL